MYNGHILTKSKFKRKNVQIKYNEGAQSTQGYSTISDRSISRK
jgi:hypothetical protein